MSQDYVSLSNVVRKAHRKISRAEILDILKDGRLRTVAYLGGNPNEVIPIDPSAWYAITPPQLATSRQTEGKRRQDNIYLEVGAALEERICIIKKLLRAANTENSEQMIAADPEKWFLSAKTVPNNADRDGWRAIHDELVQKLATTAAYARKAPVYVPSSEYTNLLSNLDEIRRAKGGRPQDEGNDLFWLMLIREIVKQIPKQHYVKIDSIKIATSLEKTQGGKFIFDQKGKKALSYDIILKRVERAIEKFGLGGVSEVSVEK